MCEVKWPPPAPNPEYKRNLEEPCSPLAPCGLTSIAAAAPTPSLSHCAAELSQSRTAAAAAAVVAVVAAAAALSDAGVLFRCRFAARGSTPAPAVTVCWFSENITLLSWTLLGMDFVITDLCPVTTGADWMPLVMGAVCRTFRRRADMAEVRVGATAEGRLSLDCRLVV